jgi:hypothetical protein
MRTIAQHQRIDQIAIAMDRFWCVGVPSLPGLAGENSDVVRHDALSPI